MRQGFQRIFRIADQILGGIPGQLPTPRADRQQGPAIVDQAAKKHAIQIGK
jgi:hypothetical protein